MALVGKIPNLFLFILLLRYRAQVRKSKHETWINLQFLYFGAETKLVYCEI